MMVTVNPETGEVLPNIFTKTALAIIKVYPPATDIAKATPKKLTRLFRHIKGKNLSEDKAKYLIDFAQTSVYAGRACKARASMITSYIGILELYCQEKLKIERQIKHLIKEEIDTIDNTVKNIQSIPGSLG